MLAATRIVIDPNIRVRGNLTLADSGDVSGPMPEVGDDVVAVEAESGLHGPACVVDIDRDRDLIYLSVDWLAWWDSTPEGGTVMFRLDEWQHRMHPSRIPGLSTLWYYAWRPFCNWQECRNWPKSERPSWRPFGDVKFRRHP